MRSAFVWVAAAAVLLLGACGDGGDDSDPGLGIDDPGAGVADPGSDVAELRSFLTLGSGPGVPELQPLWLDDEDARSSAVQTLTDAADDDQLQPELVDEAVEALETPTADGTRGAAFFGVGCAETGARLVVEGSTISAELTGGENTLCDAAVYFLVVFEIPNDVIPDNAHLE